MDNLRPSSELDSIDTITSDFKPSSELDSINIENSNTLPSKELEDSDPNLATIKAVQSGADLKSIVWAKQHMNDKEYVGWCQKFVVDASGGNRAPTAINAWETAPKKVPGLQGVKPGDKVYFSPNHAALYEGDNKIISGGLGESNIADWLKNNNQHLLGYIPK